VFAVKGPRYLTHLLRLKNIETPLAQLARRHDKWLSGRVDLHAGSKHSLRYALEIRHPSFVVKEFVDLLRAYDVALVCADTVEWPRLMDVTSDFIYCRLHGSKHPLRQRI
jgi:uncharacterized protein YecE (DUF72 family)